MRVSIIGSKGFIGSHLKGKGYDLPEYDLLKPVKIDGDVVVCALGIHHGTDKDIIAGNIVTAYNLVEGIKPGARLVYLSSVRAGDDTMYGKSKLLAEKILTHRPLSLLRINHVFGEDAKPFHISVVANFCYQVVRGQELEIKDKSINMVYIDDLVKVIEEEINNKEEYSFKVVEGYQTTIKEIADIIQSFTEKKPKTEFEHKLYKVYLKHLKDYKKI